MQISEEQLAAFRSLEEAMWISETRGDPEWFDAALAPNFTEHGASGRAWDRESIMTIPISDHIPVELPFSNFVVRPLEPTVMLITYTATVNENSSNRSSIWRHDGERWLMEFHQGTPVGPNTPIDLPLLNSARFELSRRGYDCGEVDAFIAQLKDRVK